MLTSPDFKEILNIFNNYNVRYLVVGGYAVMKYTQPRFTKDLDLWIAINSENAKRTYTALKAFGAPLFELSVANFSAPGFFYQMGRAPYRLDIMMSLPGVDFESAWENRVEVMIGGIRIPFISCRDLIQAKKASGRPQDLLDAGNLENTLI